MPKDDPLDGARFVIGPKLPERGSLDMKSILHISFAGRTLPGSCLVEGSRQFGVPCRFTVKVLVSVADQLPELLALLPILQSRSSLSVEHSSLNQLRVQNARIISVGEPMPGDLVGTSVVTVDCIEVV